MNIIPTNAAPIEHFYSHCQQLCKFIGSKESVHLRKLQPQQDWLGTPIWLVFGKPILPL